jgi:DAPG hydrolase PhiG domain
MIDPSWQGRPMDSAKWSLSRLPDGRLRMTIAHAPLQGITPAMLDWWFRNIGGTMDWQGRKVSRYHVWHPRDHIHWALARPAPGGKVAPGAIFRIVEAFQANPRYRVDVLDRVTALSEAGITLEGRSFGLQVTRLAHRFTALDTATQYDSVLEVGLTAPLIGPLLNRLILPCKFPEAMGRAWIAHNIEEVGQFEQFLPDLHATATAA